MLADSGRYVISHDRYHRDGAWFRMTPEMRRDQEVMQRFMGILLGTTEEKVDADLQAVFAHLDADPTARSDGLMGCIGYCIGARSVVCSMAAHPDRLVAGAGLHPSFCTTDGPDSPHLKVPSIPGSMYIAFGSADKMQSPADNIPLIDAVNAKENGEAEVLDGADHGFSVPKSPSYLEPAASHAYEKTLALFAAAL